MFLIIIYLISIIAWGLVMFQLGKTIACNYKNSIEHPPLLVPLTISTLSIVVESVYFGASAFFHFLGYEELFNTALQEEYWMIPKLLIAFSGILLFFKLKQNN